MVDANKSGLTCLQALDKLELLYTTAVMALQSAIYACVRQSEDADEPILLQHAFCYPELIIHWQGKRHAIHDRRSWGRLGHTGRFSTTITQPALLRHYLGEQIARIEQDYDVTIEVKSSTQSIPWPLVVDGLNLQINPQQAAMLSRCFPTIDLAQIGDDLRFDALKTSSEYPLSHFNALRTDFSLARLQHYTGTSVAHFQPYILFTNYSRYVDEFVRWGSAQICGGQTVYHKLVGPGDTVTTANIRPDENSGAAWRKYQMPAWHLLSAEGKGITLINIGVGPSNAKTICDHLAVLRPHAWLMIGHCGGLRASQTLGDYVLAHAYLREDHVLDKVLPADIPVPSIAEVQRALYDAVHRISAIPHSEIKQRLRTGTVITTDDRNWELRYPTYAQRFNLSRAVAIDMESATIAAQGYRYRVPYGTLLCVSDKPLHGEVKLPGQANRFYAGTISEHLQIGIAAVDLLRAEGDRLHSRKLRAFNEPPFR